MTDPETGRPMMYCSDGHHTAWMSASPGRSEGWVKVSDMSEKELNAAFSGTGLMVTKGRLVLA